MTINAISDIHASVDESGKVMYNSPLPHKREAYIESLHALHDYFERNLQTLSEMDFKKYDDSFFEEPNRICKNAKSMLSHMSKCIKIAERGGFTPKQTTHDFIWKCWRGLLDADDFVLDNSIKWFNPKKPPSKVTSVRDIANFIRKLGFDFDPSKLKSADCLVIAGDLGLDNFYDKVVADLEKRTKGKFKRILHIAGNHDHWFMGHERFNGGKAVERPESVNLEHDYCEYDAGDVLFLGCTLWTPLEGCDLYAVGRGMNDYNYTPHFSPHDSDAQFRIQSEWLKGKIEANRDRKIVVFTHHQPFIELIDSDYKHSDVNAAYVVKDHSLDDINRNGNIKLWICGHTHANFDGELHGVHVVRNPIGYRDHYGYANLENGPDKWYNNIIEV